jgi:phosphocarrier protein FPr
VISETTPELLVRIGGVYSSKEEALKDAGGLLTKAGCVDSAYDECMIRREKISSTYLDQGLAIPHGTLEDKVRVKKEGLAVLQVPAGVSWGPGQNATFIVAIASASEGHIAVLRRLANIMRDKALMEKMKTTTNEDEIRSVLLA